MNIYLKDENNDTLSTYTAGVICSKVSKRPMP